MATKKDLVEAHAFSRRRLVTAFVSGAPGGREVEPSRPGRTILGGVALAVLLVAGAAVLGVLRSPSTVDLDEEGLVSERGVGADYVVLTRADGEGTELRPLANVTSAMLIFGADVESREVSADEIAEKPQGPPIGILDAPETPPARANLLQSGWTACTGVLGQDPPVGIHLDLAEDPAVSATPDLSFVVRTVSGRLFLLAESLAGTDRGVARAYAYPVPESGPTDTLLLDLAGTNNPLTVPDAWITLFPPGGALSLDSFGLDRGQLDRAWPRRDDVAGAGEAEIGDLLEVGEATYLLTGADSIQLDPFSLAVYQNLPFPPGDRTVRHPVTQAPGSVDPVADLPNLSWPTVTRTASQPTGQPCVVLDTPGGQPGVVLATAPVGADAAADGLDVDDPEVSVDPGHGAFVSVGDWDGTGTAGLVLVDARGYQYAVGPGPERANLGYADEPDVIVPDAWVELFRDGVALTVDAARCPPTSDPDGATC